jgi:hypothetical protein
VDPIELRQQIADIRSQAVVGGWIDIVVELDDIDTALDLGDNETVYQQMGAVLLLLQGRLGTN